MGQHSRKPFRPNPTERATGHSKRRWVTVAAGAAVVAAASTTAWAAVANDAPRSTTTMDLAAPSPATPEPSTPAPTSSGTPSPASTPDTTPSAASKPKPSSAPRTSSAPNPPNGALPKTVKTEQARAPKKSEPAKPKTRVLSSGTCGASYYDEGQMTASGERFDPSAMTAAHKSLPMGSRVRVTNPSSGESVTVRINDRGPFVGGRCLDLSAAAFKAIGSISAGVMTVRYEVLAR
ncbi:septal ring lytic transglycosylase RlpA family protein [Nonomuraea sp. NPDC005983]|uniref:septal ring lytic transglycosylase RlpA family protein n=1 Tax=Nonomuraea sp. NPDC005983 TaxID=3155595 RepID=UPI0033B245C2